ncbi:Permease for cytosine/purines, uracil, thiamine, allantoin domain containing protein [Amanita muscaria]
MGLLKLLEVNRPEGLTYTQQFLCNEDLLPVPPEKRTWTAWNFVSFWISGSFSVSIWMLASSMIQMGMSWWQAWICIWIGYAILGPLVILNARPGAVFHVSFPVAARTSFGLFGSLWCIFNRAAMACIWYGVHASIGGDCLRVMLKSMWPSINDIPNHLPASSGTTTRDFMCFFIFWLISLPALWFPIHQIRHLFTIKAIIFPIAALAFFVWCIVKAKGIGPIVSQPATIHGSDLGWTMVFGIMASSFLTVAVNAPDFASRAATPSATVLPQALSPPIVFALVSFVGIIVTSSSTVIYGETIWSPLDLLDKFLEGSPSHATRFGVWFISAAFTIGQLALNISANTISAGCDLTALLPRFINIRRGGYIAALVGICMQPWKLLQSGNEFINYLSAYTVFLSSILGVMIADYYVVRKGHYRVADLYDSRKDGWYWYTYGINFRCIRFPSPFH